MEFYGISFIIFMIEVIFLSEPSLNFAEKNIHYTRRSRSSLQGISQRQQSLDNTKFMCPSDKVKVVCSRYGSGSKRIELFSV